MWPAEARPLRRAQPPTRCADATAAEVDRPRFADTPPGNEPEKERSDKELYTLYMEEAKKHAERLKKKFDENAVQTTEKDLIPFVYV